MKTGKTLHRTGIPSEYLVQYLYPSKGGRYLAVLYYHIRFAAGGDPAADK